MSSLPSRFPERAASVVLLLGAVVAWSPDARAQACCAGTGAVTPGRLALHEAALVGVQLKAASLFGSWDSGGRYVGSPRGASETDFEQDLFAAVRVLKRGQVALLVPFVETRRTSTGLSELGGGIGDLNANVRYDFTLAGTHKIIPGIAGLLGVTFPTGKPPDAQGLGPLATGATGVGAYQANLGLALEQSWGPWLVSATAIVAQRFARSVDFPAMAGAPSSSIHEQLGLQVTVLSSVAYVFPSEIAVAFSASYTVEGGASIDGASAPDTGHRLPGVALSGVLPIGDRWRVQAALTLNPPIGQLGLNQPALAGGAVTGVWSWM